MSTHAAIITRLAAVTAVTDLASNRIHSSAPDDVEAPLIIFQQIAATPGQVHDGATGGTFRLFQFSCFADTPTAARALRDAVITALDGVELSTGDNPTLEDERDGDAEDATHLYRADADFLI